MVHSTNLLVTIYMEILKLLHSLTIELDTLDIPYMITGSIALNFYTIGRATRDIDVVVNMREEHIDRFVSGLADFYFNKNTIIDEVQRRGMFNIIDTISGFKIDIILLKDHGYAIEAFNRRVIFENLGFRVYVCSAEDLIIAKLLWIQQIKSDRQIDDIRMLLAIEGLDMNYLRTWCNKLQLNTYGLIDK